MGKAKLLGRVSNPPQRGNKERLRWQAQQSRNKEGCQKKTSGCHGKCPEWNRFIVRILYE